MPALDGYFRWEPKSLNPGLGNRAAECTRCTVTSPELEIEMFRAEPKMIRSGIHPALLWGKKLLRKLRARPEMLEGPKGVEELGHRLYVGGHWEEMGDLQYRFMLSQGLKPSDCLVDVACGSLRGGRHFIEYLDQGNYLGLDQENPSLNSG